MIIDRPNINAKYKHGKYGTFMFNALAVWTKFLVKHKWLYYLLSCTWGLILTVLGWIITICLGICNLFTNKIKFKRYNWIYGITVGPEYWGGFEMGLMYVRDQKSWDSLDAHEFGHTFQNCLFGPLMPILVSIPSAIRYWYQTIREWQGKDNKPYDSMWFEDAATQCGLYADKFLKYSKKVK